ncbi:M24 family metallopeptidase [Enterococcus hermanniensis]|uniref:Xaa-Pro dipeptidase n=1 Tax=Enterococcus hermanniensis TaxID=249189 RepID=A0A1L8TMJ5_9ENTE|nr:Xaa-Pro peptidase family protein [Enterococcus hermanniensis]OJG45314.1 hypothetical protein RV04_GL002362 [Enterococcus hermanniensis]
MKEERVERVIKKMKDQDYGQLLISDPTTIFYLTGRWIHPGERLLVLVITPENKNTLIVNKLFPIDEDLGVEKVFIDDTDDAVQKVLDYVDTDKKIGIDKNWPAHFLLRLLEIAPNAQLGNGSEVTDAVRAVKDADELDLMREVSRDNDIAVGRLKDLLPEELTELEMRDKLADIYADLGNSGFSFDPIVGYGANAADPHHETDNSKVKPGDSIILDIGGIKNSYASDMTRTVFYKEVSDKAREIYEIVLEANRRAIEMVKPGVKFSDLDAAARDYITEQGYGEYFTHRLGHFIGIDCHEAGDVSAANHNVAEPGMVFSIEPGIYVPGEVGVRIEDLIICTEDGYENLNHYPKDLEIVG